MITEPEPAMCNSIHFFLIPFLFNLHSILYT